MPNLTTPIPPKITGNSQTDISALKKWGTALIDELSYIFDNLDAGNVSEAASVKAENIDTTNARITNAQIDILSADKLRAGQVDTDLVTVSSESGNLSISGNSIKISDSDTVRFRAEYDPQSDTFGFSLMNEDGQPTVYISSTGNAVFSGKIDSSEIYSSTIVGTDSISYAEKNGGIFAVTTPQGLSVMQDKDNSRLQKIGLTVGEDGTAYFVLGAGDGTNEMIINDFTYSDGSFLLQKTSSDASMGIVGDNALLSFLNGGTIKISGESVLINGRDILAEIDNIKNNL